MCADMCADKHIDMCADMRVDMRIGMCADMHVDMHIDMCADMCADMHIDMCADMCADVCVGMCVSMCVDMCAGRHVCRHVHRQATPDEPKGFERDSVVVARQERSGGEEPIHAAVLLRDDGGRSAAIYFFGACRRPTADDRGWEGSHPPKDRLSRVFRHLPDRSASSAFAVGMRRGIGKPRSAAAASTAGDTVQVRFVSSWSPPSGRKHFPLKIITILVRTDTRDPDARTSHIAMCAHMRVDMCARIRVDMCAHLRVDMCADVRAQIS